MRQRGRQSHANLSHAMNNIHSLYWCTSVSSGCTKRDPRELDEKSDAMDSGNPGVCAPPREDRAAITKTKSQAVESSKHLANMVKVKMLKRDPRDYVRETKRDIHKVEKFDGCKESTRASTLLFLSRCQGTLSPRRTRSRRPESTKGPSTQRSW